MVIDTVKKGVIDGDVKRVRQALAMTAYMANKKAHEDFRDSVIYAEKEITDLFEADNGVPLLRVLSPENYIAMAKMLTMNFSKEKTNIILEVGDKLYEQNEEKSSLPYVEESDFFEKKSSQNMISKIEGHVTTVTKRIPKYVWIVILVLLIVAIVKMFNH